MNLIKENKNIKCDTVMCKNLSNYSLVTNSYKGNTYLCNKCFIEMQKLFKRTFSKNEK